MTPLEAGRKRADARIKEQSATQANGCIFMRGQKSRPAIEINHKRYLVSRYLMMRKIGRELIAAEYACHTCDEPRCINLNHLFIGSHSDNMQDAARKGRTYMQKIKGTPKAKAHSVIGANASRGSNPGAKLTKKQVEEIRKRHWRKSHNVTNTTALAKEYGVSSASIRSIISETTWSSAKRLLGREGV